MLLKHFLDLALLRLPCSTSNNRWAPSMQQFRRDQTIGLSISFQKNCEWSVAQICCRARFKFEKICWCFVSYMHANCAKLSLNCCEVESQPKKIPTQMPFSNALFSNLLTPIWFETQLRFRTWRLLLQFSFALLLLLVLLLLMHDGRAIVSCKGISGMKWLKPLTRRGR